MPAKLKAEEQLPLKTIVTTLVALRDELDSADDTISGALQGVERVLRASVSTRISVAIAEDPREGTTDCLTFGKYERRFQLIWETGRYDGDGDFAASDQSAVLSMSREFRCRMFADGHIENLIRSASAQIASQIEERAKALAAAKRISDALITIPAEQLAAASESVGPDDDIPF